MTDEELTQLKLLVESLGARMDHLDDHLDEIMRRLDKLERDNG